METNTIQHSQQFLRKRKFLVALPLLVLPSIVLLFWALGGGKPAGDPGDTKQQTGMNTSVPGPHLGKAKDKDKMGVYEQASKDSAKRRDQMKNDPYYNMEFHFNDTIKSNTAQLENILQHNAAKFNQPNFSKLQTSTTKAAADANEQKVIQKLAQLKAVLSKKSNNDSPPVAKTNTSPEVNKLESMMQMINNKSSDPDPEVNQLNGMLDKIMLVQHPEKMQDSMRRLSDKNKMRTYVVTTGADENKITLLDTNQTGGEASNGFYGLSDDDNKAQSQNQNAIEAIIPESQTLVSGATVKLRLLNDIFVNGIKIPKDEFVYGTASLGNERLKITINSVRYKNNILQVSLSVYDLDGMAGIYIPGSINRDVSKESADEAISTLGLNPVEESVGAQAAVAGIQAAKTLASKKIRLIRVNLPSGYKVLLKDNNQKN